MSGIGDVTLPHKITNKMAQEKQERSNNLINFRIISLTVANEKLKMSKIFPIFLASKMPLTKAQPFGVTAWL